MIEALHSWLVMTTNTSTTAVRTRPLVLIIEDSYENQVLISSVLKQEGFDTLLAPDGEQGINLADANLPDLIICDIMMPVQDGHAVLQKLQSQSRTATIPFIFLTALSSKDNLRTGMDLGADDYLTKPVRPKELVSAVQTRLRRGQQVRAEQYERFAQQLVQLQEKERQNTATVLQNRINQTLSGLKLSFNLLETGSTAHDPIYSDARIQLDNLIRLVDNMAQELHPTMLNDLGLAVAIRWLASQYDLDITLSMHNMDYEFDPTIEITAFRIIQLALDNVMYHAKTRSVQVELTYDNANLHVKIEDHGVGFVLESALQSQQSLDLLSMYQRAAIVGGNLLINSTPENGTVVLAQFPLSETAYQPQPIARNVLANSLGRKQGPTITTQTEQEVRLAIAIEPPLQRQGLRRLLTANPNLHLAAEVGNLEEIPAVLKKHRPDVLIINPVMGQKPQHEVLQSIVAGNPDVNILVIASQTNTEYVVNALESGALGYVPLNTTMTDLYTAIINVARGQMYLSPLLKQNEVLAKLKLRGE